MNRRFARSFAVFATLFAGPAAMAQVNILYMTPEAPPVLLPIPRLDLPSASLFLSPNTTLLKVQSPTDPPPRVSKVRFAPLSAAVYGAAFADMHQTLDARKYSWWHENDPLAEPFVRLPAPAYYAAGLAMASAVNLVAWKMAHSRRWHKLSPIPQLLTMSGNLYGFHSNFR